VYHFLLIANCTRGRILHRLWNTAFDRSTVSLFCYCSCVGGQGIQAAKKYCRKVQPPE